MLEAISSNTTAPQRATTSFSEPVTATKANKAVRKAAKALREAEEEGVERMTVEEIRQAHKEMAAENRVTRNFARLHALPFVKKEGKGKAHYWSPNSSGDWHEDYYIGMAYAVAYLEEAAWRVDNSLLLRIVLDMPRKSSGVLVGFLDGVERAAKEGRHVTFERLTEGDDGCHG